MMNSDFEACRESLQACDRFLVLTHKRPDGDAIGSAAALCHALRRLGKAAHLYRNPEITDTFVPFADPYLAEGNCTADTVIAVDISSESMLPSGFKGNVDICIDHHPNNTLSAGASWVNSEKASCGELVLQMIRTLCGGIDREEADLLYMAVSSDTGCFCYSNTSADTFAAASELMKAGADLPNLNKLLFRTKKRSRLLLEGMIYSSLRSFHNGEMNCAVITLDMIRSSGATEDDFNDLANLAGVVDRNRVAVTVREVSQDPPHCKVSLRTDGGTDASAVCRKFGGGGHVMASGCELDLSPEETLSAVTAAVEEAWG